MPYIGPSAEFAYYSRYTYTASGGETSISGSDDNGQSLAFTSGVHVSVTLNGILLVPSTDYNTNTANTIAGLAALSSGDVLEVVVYTLFSVADAVPATGGTFSGNVTMGGTLSVTGASTLTGDLTVDTDTLYVDSTNNRVGVGTASPASAAHISSSTYPQLEIDDKASRNYAMGVTSSTFRIRDVTGTADRLTIDSSGTVSFGGISGRATSSTGHLSISEQSDNRSYVELATTTTLSRTLVAFLNSNGSVGSIAVSGSATSYNTSSDYRLKMNVTADWDATTRLKQLNPVRFNFIADPDTTVDGFLAHEVQSVVPEAISGTHDEVETWTQNEIDAGDAPANTSAGDNKLDEDGNTIPVYQGIDQSKLVPLLVKTIQELEARITALENVE